MSPSARSPKGSASTSSGLFADKDGAAGKLLGKLFSSGIEASADKGIEAVLGDEHADPLERFMKGQLNALDDNIKTAEERFIRGKFHELAGLTAGEASTLHARLTMSAAAAESVQQRATVQAWLRFLASSHTEPASNQDLALGRGQGVLHVWLKVFGPQYFEIKGALLNGVNEHVLAEIAHQPLGTLLLDKVFDCGDFQIHQKADGNISIHGDATWLDMRAEQAGKLTQWEGAQLLLADLAKHECGDVAGRERELQI
jgi:hypothetical protein